MTRSCRWGRSAVACWLVAVCASGCKSSSSAGPGADAAGVEHTSADDASASGGVSGNSDAAAPDASGSGGGAASGGVSGSGGRSATGGAAGDAGGMTGASGGKTGGMIGSGGRGPTGSGGRGASGGVDGGSSTGGTAGRTAPVPVQNLPVIMNMPDPMTMNDGTKVTTEDQWRARRQEMIQTLQDYQYGHIPPPPGNVTATEVTAAHVVSAGSGQASHRMLHLTFGPSGKLGFDLGIFTPVSTGTAPASYPVLVDLTSAADDKSLGSASVALGRGYIVATIPYQQLGADTTSWASSAFFAAYPDYDWRDIAAWAWGMSRAVDYLVTDPTVDASKIAITGVSRLGQATLLAGALDERIALSAPVAAGSALRYSGQQLGGPMMLGQGILEIVNQNTYWFGPRFADFKNQPYKLPSDMNWMPALTAPRLFIMCNSLMDQYGRAYAVEQTYLSAQPVFDFLGVSDNLGLSFRPGMHGITSDDWSALLDFADQYLLQKGGTRKFNVLPPADQTP